MQREIGYARNGDAVRSHLLNYTRLSGLFRSRRAGLDVPSDIIWLLVFVLIAVIFFAVVFVQKSNVIDRELQQNEFKPVDGSLAMIGWLRQPVEGRKEFAGMVKDGYIYFKDKDDESLVSYPLKQDATNAEILQLYSYLRNNDDLNYADDDFLSGKDSLFYVSPSIFIIPYPYRTLRVKEENKGKAEKITWRLFIGDEKNPDSDISKELMNSFYIPSMDGSLITLRIIEEEWTDPEIKPVTPEQQPPQQARGTPQTANSIPR